MSSLTTAAAADLFRRAPDRLIDVGEGQAALRTVGRGPDVLFVHGWPVSGATFRLLLPHLTDHVTCHVIDLPGTGQSRFDARTRLGVDQHIESVRRVIDALAVDALAVVGHDSGGMIARHAIAGDGRIRAVGLIDTEQPDGLGWRFRTFLAASRLPGFGRGLAWAAGQRRVRRHRLVLGGAFSDRDLLEGEFDEFFLRPLHDDARLLDAAVRTVRTFERRHVDDLAAAHRRIAAPVQLVWGADDLFFPVARARSMVATFADARLTEVEGAGLFSHEERPAEVAAALLPTLLGDR